MFWSILYVHPTYLYCLLVVVKLRSSFGIALVTTRKAKEGYATVYLVVAGSGVVGSAEAAVSRGGVEGALSVWRGGGNKWLAE